MPRTSRLRWVLLATWAVAALAQAQSGDATIELDGARSRAEFRVKLIWLVGVHGEFGSVRGQVQIDRFRNRAVVDAHIDAASVRMSSRGYEEWVKSPEFFDAAAHPDIHFVSAPFSLQRLHRGGELPGVLTVRGVSAPVRFTLAPSGCERPGYDCTIAAAGTISRSAFRMHSRLGLLSDKVDLRFTVFASDPAPAP